MPYLNVFALAVGLSMDAVAVAFARGFSAPQSRWRDALLTAGLFGGAQGMMPLLGVLILRLLGADQAAWFSHIDHWVAFALLVGLGAKMVWGARQADDDDSHASTPEPYALRVMVPLAVATSIDALAAGFTLPSLGVDVGWSVTMIGIVTAILSAAAVVVGRTLVKRSNPTDDHKLAARMETIGGVTLVVLGCKILVEHLSH